MRASAEPDPTVVVVRRRRLPRLVVWLLWLLGALLGSVLLGFLAGLARPREPDPWAAGTPSPPSAPPSPPSGSPASPPDPDVPPTTSSNPAPAAAEDD